MAEKFFPSGGSIAHVYVDESQIIKVMDALDATYKEARPALKEAINNTAKEAQTRLINRARQVYIYNKRLAKKDLKLTKATVGNLEARLQATGQGIELMHFSARGPVAWSETVPGAPATRGHAVRQNPMKSLVNQNIKAFIARMPSGHKTVVRRSPDWQSKNTSLGNRYLQTILTVSVPGMIGNEEKVWKYVSPDLGRMLELEVSKAISRRKP